MALSSSLTACACLDVYRCCDADAVFVGGMRSNTLSSAIVSCGSVEMSGGLAGVDARIGKCVVKQLVRIIVNRDLYSKLWKKIRRIIVDRDLYSKLWKKIRYKALYFGPTTARPRSSRRLYQRDKRKK